MRAHTLVRWFDLRERLSPLLKSLVVGSASSENLSVAWVEGAAGTRVPTHKHSQDQFTVVISGQVRVTVNSDCYELGAGQAISIPGCVPHAAEILADAVYLDIFHPVREDFDLYPCDARKETECS